MRVSVHVPDEIGEEAQKYADKEDVSVSQFYAQAVEAALEERKRREACERISALAGTMDSAEYPFERFQEAQREFRREDPNRQ
jgi:metal-responsive CopG/Arc/MetJ family transcriptional regulator